MGKDKRIQREGTCQSERFPKPLQGDYFKIDERSFSDFIAQMAEYAQFVKFFNDENIEDGDWKLFFEEIYDYNNKKVKISAIKKMEENKNAPPHIALFLSFLGLFKSIQENINTLTIRHLDFYYRELLQFKPRPIKPDTVPVFFELNKAAKPVLIPKNTLLDAGKDNKGNTLSYRTKNDLIVNHAEVDFVSLVIEKENESLKIINLSGAMHQLDVLLPNINSVLLKKEDKGNKTEFGFFALASPLFRIHDGDRKFLLKLKDKKIDLSKFSKIEYTTEDGWKSTDKVENLIIIPDSYPAITPYDEKVHQATLDTDFPVLRFVYESNDAGSLLNKNISIEIDVKKSKDVQLKNDLGSIDGSCSFLPFGYLPYIGSDFYIVNPFIFNKYLKRLKLNGRSEKLTGILNKEIYKGQSLPIDSFPKLIDVSWNESTETNDQLGFVKLTSKSDFGYATHQNNYLNQINETLRETIKKNGPFSGLENFTPFHPPKISDFSIDYKMAINLSTCRRYEILPAKQLEYSRVITELTNLNKWMSKRTFIYNNAKIKLIEKFSYIISLKRIEGPCIISLYFRLKDSGILHTNMDKKQPTWHYLSDRKWKQFKDFEIIRDTTDGFLQSGHVYFKIGDDAIITDSESNKQLFLKLAYPKILISSYPILEGVHTQSIDATFINQNNALDGLPQNLPANTITRFQKPIQGIKSVMQPYQASGGRAAETSEEFYTRVSERLRHKNRAWNIWDYERIVLENFPEIYKVKCIPYADEKGYYTPGSVLLVLLPDCNSILQNDILKPVVPLSILREVKHLIAGCSSPFVKVNVCNVSFVELKISCTIVLKKEYNDHSFYRNLLNEELNRLISPWIDSNNEIKFGRTFTLSQILYFIEQREYIDYIVQDKGIKITVKNREIIKDEYCELLSQNEILTSAKEHNITILN